MNPVSTYRKVSLSSVVLFVVVVVVFGYSP
jgi:hypothetical protein